MPNEENKLTSISGSGAIDIGKNIGQMDETGGAIKAGTKKGISFNESEIINIEDTTTGLMMLDKLTRIKDGRRIEPLDPIDNINYQHRYMYDTYNLQIGDTYFMVPPEFIMVTSESTSQSIVTLRQENTQKLKAGYHKRTILIDLVFNGLDQLNGYKVEGPEGYYYVDGLRQLLAQFKCTPILPISNELINGMYGIFTVALQSITMSTMPGFPDAMTAQITLQEINMFPYIEMPDICYKYMIDWDLFRYYYQRLLTENHTYKKLQSLPKNKDYTRFKLSILDESVFNSQEATKSNLINIICDINKVNKDENGNPISNYTTWVDSDTSNVAISSFQCGYSNILTNIQMSDISSPTVQFMGGMDTIYNIIFETTDYSIVQSLEQCQVSNNLLTRNNIKYRSVGFVKLESELVEFTGSLFVMIESVTTNTVPGFPGLYNVQMNCVAYDIAQSERENLSGFRPFDCKKYDCINNDFEPDHVHAEQAIEQSMTGLKRKIKQDNYAEWKIRNTMEVYPDLHLPKYAEVDEFINKCKAFRESKGLSPLPYDKYPVNPVSILHGANPDNNISVKTTKGVAYAQNIKASILEYNIYVDPDFYVFYPHSYLSFQTQEEADNSDFYSYEPKQRSSYTKTKIIETAPDYTASNANSSSNTSVNNSSLVEQFISLAKTFIGHTYVWGAEGEVEDAKGKCFDCSGFVTYLLKEIGVMPMNKFRFVVSSMPGDSLFEEIPWSKMQRGDILCNYELSHVVIYEGNNTIIHASNSAPYPKGGVKEGNLYFTGGRCLRPKAFIGNNTSVSNNITSSTSTDGATINSTAKQLWSMLKLHGLSDFAVAGILGNAMAESGLNSGNLQNSYETSLGYSDTSYTQSVDNGSYNNFIRDAAGYGLFQFTYWSLKQDVYNEAKRRGVSISDRQMQIDVMVQQIKNNGVFDRINNATSVREASNIFLFEYEKPANQGISAQNKRGGYAQEYYDQFKGSDAVVSSSNTSEKNTLTTAEFESICRVIMAETKGEGSNAEKAVAQVIYDRLTHPDKKFGGLSNILNSSDQFEAPYSGELNSTIENNVKDVFCENKKYWPDYKAWYFLTPDDTNATFKDRDSNYDRLGETGKHTFWGKETKGSDIKFTITDSDTTGNASDNVRTEVYEIKHDAKTISDVGRFGEPVLVETEAIVYDDATWQFWRNSKAKEKAKEVLNDGANIFNTSFCDEHQYSARGRLVRAFPTYLFCVLDDDAQWFDGRKLWTNYYVHQSVVDIAVHGTNDMPTETATITVNNSYHNLDRTQGGLDSYNIAEDSNGNLIFGDKHGYSDLQRWVYKKTHMVLGLGPKLTDKLIKLHQVIYDHAKLREGARIHLRMGYGSDPLSLAPVINGSVSDISLGDQISIVVTSDGHELLQHIVSAKEDDTNNGFLGLFGIFEDQESSNIISNIMCERESWMNYLMGSTFEGSKYSIEHFGLYFNQSLMATIAGFFENAWDFAVDGAEVGGDVGNTIGLDIPVVSDITEVLGMGVGFVAGGILGIGDSVLDLTTEVFADLWNGYQEQYDILKNIYKADYTREHYIYSDILGGDGEYNVVFDKYNMTPWDVCQVCTQQVPEYIVKPSYHQFDSRLYFGLPFWMEKYRYDYLDGKVYEECKASTQARLLDITNIIDNQVKVTSKFSNTNVKVMYGLGDDPVSTKTIYSDDTIDFGYQKTTIIDSPITQDALGPDALYEFIGYKVGEDSARRVGISNLLYGWQQQYQGEIILMGCPGIKPHDYILINDRFANLYGVAIVREVVHSFNTNTGFTTSVTPGMIGFSTDDTSGLVETTKNMLMILNCFSSYLETRRQMRNNYEKYLNIFSNFEILRNKFTALAQKKYPHLSTISALTHIGLLVAEVRAAYVIAKNIKNLATGLTLVNKFMTAYKSIKGTATGIKITIDAIKGGTTVAAGAVTGGAGSIVMFVLWTIVDLLLQDVLEWLSNRNVCCLLPLWWENTPFVAGTKGGRNILLVQGTDLATEEDKRDADVVENKNYHYYDGSDFSAE